MQKCYHIFAYCVILLGLGCHSFAQHLVEVNPSETEDLKTSFVNPAVSVFQDPHVLAGMKLYHVGFLDNNSIGLRQTFIAVGTNRLPYFKGGLGFTAVQLVTPIHSKTIVGVSLSKKLFSGLALGFGLDILNQGFDETAFDLIYDNDPVFKDGTSKTSVGLTAGFYCRLFPALSTGFSVYHFNKPNIALHSDSAIEPMLMDFGLSCRFSFFRFSGGFEKIESNVTPTFSFTTDYWRFAKFQIGYRYSGLLFGFHLDLSQKLSFYYQLDYPVSEVGAESFGSHQIGFSYYFKEPVVPQNQFTIAVETDSLCLFRLQLEETIDPNVPDSLTDKIQPMIEPATAGIVCSDSVETAFNPRHYSKPFLALLDSAKIWLQKKRLNRIEILCLPEEKERASGIRHYLSGGDKEKLKKVSLHAPQDFYPADSLLFLGSESDSEKTVRLYGSRSETRFFISASEKRRADTWVLEIRNQKREVVRHFAGTYRAPSKIDWDWKNELDQYVKPGWYTAQFEWEDRGRIQVSNTVRLKVKLRSLHYCSEITKQIQKLEIQPNALYIHLQNH